MFVAMSLWDSEIILKDDVQRQKYFCSTDIIKVPTFVLSLWIWIWELAAADVHPISFLFTFVSIIFLLQLARQHRGHYSCYN